MATSVITLEEIQQNAGDLAGHLNNFIGGFYDAYNNGYDLAVAQGRSSFDAQIAGLESGIRANAHYADLNAQRYANNPDLSFSQTYQNLANHYNAMADSLVTQSIHTQDQLNGFLGNMKTQALSDLGTFGNSAAGRALGEYLGPAFDAYQIGQAALNQDWNGLGKAGTSLLLAEAFGYGAMALLGAFGLTVGLPVTIAIGLAAVLGGYLGGMLWDEVNGPLQDKLGELGDSIRGDDYRIERYDPIALDLDGDGVVSTIVDGDLSGPLFDYDGDGIRTATGWVGARDGLLVRDIDGSGAIENGSELFGDRTRLRNGRLALNGMEALADLDSNGDGSIDAADAAFSSLKIWQDGNGNGISESSELKTLAELGITRLSTNFVGNGPASDDVPGGNLMGTSSYTRVDANGVESTRLMQDFNFDADTIHSRYVDRIVIPEALAGLANLQGMGMLRDLREAASLSPALLQAIQAFSAATTRSAQRELLGEVLYQWARTNPRFSDESIALYMSGGRYDENSENVIRLRPGEQVFVGEPGSMDEAYTRKVRVVEAILGMEPISAVFWGTENLNNYGRVYDAFFEGSYAQLALQTRLQAYINKVTLTIDTVTGKTDVDFAPVDTVLLSRYAADRTNAAIDLVELARALPRQVSGAVTWTQGETLLRAWMAENAQDATFIQSLEQVGLRRGIGGTGDDTILGGDTPDVSEFISAGAGDDVVFGGQGRNIVRGEAGDDVLYGGAQQDQLDGGAGADTLHGGAGDDSLDGRDGRDRLFGGAGADSLNGGAGDDRIDGGAGDDYLDGGTGNDLYVFGRGSGHDRIYNHDASQGRIDVLEMGSGVLASDLKVWRSGDYLCIQISGTDDRIDIQNYFRDDGNSAYRVDLIRFADGTQWTIADVKQIVLVPTPGVDDRYGYESDDVIQGGDGNEWLSGRGGNDSLAGRGGADRLNGDDGDDALDGGTGNDHLSGGDGADLLLGGEGDDYLDGGNGNDRLEGGAGNDTLQGGSGNDRYIFANGFGRDVINNYDAAADRLDTVEFLPGIDPADVRATRVGNDLLLQLANGTDMLTVQNYFGEDAAGPSRIDEIRFANGASWSVAMIKSMVQAATVGDDVLRGYEGDDVLLGLQGNDDISGGAGADQLSGGEGDDLLQGEAGDDLIRGEDGNDTITGGEGADQIFGGNGMDALYGGSGADILEGGDDRDWMAGDQGDDLLLGGGGDDELLGGSGNDVLAGGIGNDVLEGGEGDDEYRFSTGDGRDWIVDDAGASTLRLLGVVESSVFMRREGSTLVLRIDQNGVDEIRVDGIFDAVSGLATRGLRLIIGNAAPRWMDASALDQQVLVATSHSDVIVGSALGNVIHGADGDDQLLGEGGDDLLEGDNGDDRLFGGEGNDTLRGGAGADVLDGGAGADRSEGGQGDDVYIVDDAGDVVIEAAAEGRDTVHSSVNHGLAANVEDLLLTGNGSIDGAGNELANVLNGNEGANRLDGGAGDDQLFGGQGNDRLLGGSGNDVLDGQSGDDHMEGGAGDDVYHVDSQLDSIVELAGEGVDVVHATSDYALSSNIERLVLVEASGAITGTGSADNNELTGNSNSNRLDGGAGADRMLGGLGDDTYVVDQTGDAVVELAGEGHDTVESSIDYVLGDTLEDLVLTGAGNINGTGNGGNNQLTGNAGNNRLDGGAGGDRMQGGEGDDYYINDSSGDWIVEHAGEGVDTIERRYETNLVLADEVENLILAAGVQTGNGNGLDNVITGNAGANTLGGWDGEDLLYGLDGNDSLFGGSGSDTLYGGNGNDYHDGGEGIDRMEGGAGDDIYIVDDSGDVVVEAVGAGKDQVQSSASYVLSDNIENLFLTGADAINGGGNALDNYLAGNAEANIIHGMGGNDTIVGGGGNDTLVGGSGDDKYVFDTSSGTDTVDNTGGGFDGVFFTGGISRERISFSRDGNDLLITLDNAATPAVRVTNHFLGGDAAIDYVQPDGGSYLTTAQINQIVAGGSTGGQFDQVIQGTAAGEQLAGSAGKDLIEGLGGADTLFGMGGNDTLRGGDGNDYLSGGNGSGSGSGDDRLEGGLGNDTLRGEDGSNVLIGGTGDDQYVYGGGIDVIDNTGGGTDWLIFQNDITLSKLAFARDGDNLVITINGNANQKVTVTNHFMGGDMALDYLQPAGGSALNTAAINALVPGTGSGNPGGGNDGDYPSQISGTGAGEQLVGTSGRDRIQGLGGDDTLFGMGGDDKLDGGDGNDYLSGGNGSFSGSGNDILIGGAGDDQLVGEDGNDMLFGGVGNDTYFYRAGGGVDTVDNTGGGTDWLYFDGIARSRLSYYRDGDDLLVRVDGDAAQQMRVLKHFQGGQYAIAFVQPGDGGNAISASAIAGQLKPLPAAASLASVRTMDTSASAEVRQLIDAISGFTGDGSTGWSETQGLVPEPLMGHAGYEQGRAFSASMHYSP